MSQHYIFFSLRTVVEFDDIDRCSKEAWSETLDNFGYTLTSDIYMRDLKDRTSDEVMKALCPYTTQMEWAPVVNKRDVRLRRELMELVEVECLPRDGAAQFLRDCYASGEAYIVITTNFIRDLAKCILEKAGLLPYVHAVCPYHELEFGLLDALEFLKIPPPTLPPNIRTEFDALPKAASASGIFVCFACDVEAATEAKRLGFHLIVGLDVTEEKEMTRTLLNTGAKSTLFDFKNFRFEYIKMLV